MAEEEEHKCPECEPGLPAWLATFGDLMSLLMCFFVLLLSFSEMDAQKFKKMAGSMAQAFGVQLVMKVDDIPKGTSIIAQEFSPGRPDPTPINEIYQHTDDITKMSLDVDCSEEFDVEQGSESIEGGVELQTIEKMEKLQKETEADAIALAETMKEQIVAGQVEVETKGRSIIIRIREQGSFYSGSAELHEKYVPVLAEVRELLSERPGDIQIQGHTDDVPINTPRFRSNWELSAARAVSVAHELLRDEEINPTRMTVSGLGETRPLIDNKTAENRAVNRRVEIVISQGVDKELQDQINALKYKAPAVYQQLEPEYKFDLKDNEIF